LNFISTPKMSVDTEREVKTKVYPLPTFLVLSAGSGSVIIMLVVSVIALVALTIDLVQSPVKDRGQSPIKKCSNKYYYHLRGSYNDEGSDSESQWVRLFRHMRRDRVEVSVTLLFLLTIVLISFLERGECNVNSEAMRAQTKTMLKVLVEQGHKKDQEKKVEDEIAETRNTTVESPIKE